MSDERSDALFGLIIAFGLGFVAAMMLLKRETVTATQTLQQSETQRRYGFMGKEVDASNLLANWKPLEKMPSVDRLDEFKPIPVGIETQEVQHESGTTHYKNDEKMRVMRGPDGFISGYDTGRDAEIRER